MSNPQQKSTSTISMLRTLAGVATLSGFLIVFVYEFTFPIIKKNRAEVLKKAIFQVMPAAKSYKKFAEKDGKLVEISEDQEIAEAYYGCYDDTNNLIGFALEASGMGFVDIIKVLYGYSTNKEAVIGNMVLETKETPGLGDKIEKDADFVRNFEELDVKLTEDGSKLQNPIEVVKKGKKTEKWQIDAITGATISSKAIGKILLESTQKRLPVIHKSLDVLGASK
ncbi:MAG: FMN-binding protein [Spirochaetia bacterium]|nr:FMN-binding protein [Spirochaetia bacterium]